MLDLPPPNVLVLGHTASVANIAAEHIRENSSALVMDCGTDVHRAFLTIGTTYLDAVLAFSNGEDGFLDEVVAPLIRRTWVLTCPMLVIGLSEKQKRRLEEREHNVLRVLTREAPLEEFWEELEAMGVERRVKSSR